MSHKLRALIESGLVDRGDGTILDVRTNLLWDKVGSQERYNLKESEGYCKSLTLAGYNDWRIPTFEELGTLINEHALVIHNKQRTLAIDPIFECEKGPYWTSTTDSHIDPCYSSCAWNICFYDNCSYCSSDVNYYYVRSVRNNV